MIGEYKKKGERRKRDRQIDRERQRETERESTEGSINKAHLVTTCYDTVSSSNNQDQ